MKKIISLLIILFLIIPLASCKKEAIKIGYIGNLSSKTSQLAIDARNGIEIGVKQINDAGGINGSPIQLVIKNDEADPEHAIQMHEAFKEEGVHFVVGHLTSDMASVVTASQGEDLLFISPSMSTDSLSNKDDYFLRTSPINSRQADVLSRYFHKYNINHISVVYDLSNEEYTQNLYDALVTYYEKDGFYIDHVLTYDSRVDDIDSVTENLIGLKAQDIFIISQASDTAYFIQKLKLDNPDIRPYSVSWSMTNDLIINGGSAVENTIFVGIYVPEDISEDYKTFMDLYRENYKVEPTFISVLAYDALLVLVEGIEKSDTLNPKSVKEKIIEIGSFDALRVSFSVDKYGDNDRMYMLYQFRDGEFLPLRDW